MGAALSTVVIVLGLLLLVFSLYALATGLFGAAGARFLKCPHCGRYSLSFGTSAHDPICPASWHERAGHLWIRSLERAHLKHP